ncbi:hypothetical protein PVK06_048367 [Gossypium arboreum]|uniref:Uncharacterized protein n=1 Tax=Gossypium arboreum TaxID=29729 RepID=A0ABR0MHS7_GOSAR|nr:hypothetical protein PVK06_048367 [Gossypium arboreum]
MKRKKRLKTRLEKLYRRASGERSGEAMEETVQALKKGKTSVNKFLDGLKYMNSMEAMNTVMGIANLLRLATTYGMSV